MNTGMPATACGHAHRTRSATGRWYSTAGTTAGAAVSVVKTFWNGQGCTEDGIPAPAAVQVLDRVHGANTVPNLVHAVEPELE